MAVLSSGDKRLGAVLLDSGYVNDESLQQAIGQQADIGGKLSDVLVNMGIISEHRIARAIEEAMGIPLVNVPRIEVSGEALAKVPADLALELHILPFSLEGNRLRVAFSDPLDTLSIEELEDETGCIVEPYKALRKELQWGLANYYPELGLEPPNDVVIDTTQRFGQLAIQRGFLTEKELASAIETQNRTGGLLGRILLQMGFVTHEQTAQLLAEQNKLRYLAKLDDDVDPQLAIRLLRLDALQFNAVPYEMKGSTLVVAIADPRQMGELKDIINQQVEFVCAPEPEVRRVIEKLYADDKGRLGETLLKDNKIKREQLRQALNEQTKIGRVKPLGEILIDFGFVTSGDVEEALSKQRTGGGKLEDTLVQSGKISPEMLARSLATQLNYEFVDEDRVEIDPYAVSIIPEATIKRYNIMPLRLEGSTLVVAMKDPRHVFALDDLRLLTGKEIQPAVATEETLQALINRHFRGGPNMDALAKELVEEVGGNDENLELNDDNLDDSVLVKLVNNIIREAIINEISDIHIEPNAEDVLVRVRKDGMLQEYMHLPKASSNALSSRIKIMGNLNIAEKRLPQDGRIRYKYKNMTTDLRLSTLPTVYGEKAVMRVLKKADSIPELEQLGFAPHNFQRFNDIIHKPYGMFLITGPTGSGKSFTTFSILKRLAKPEVNVTTVEDPVEYEIPGINQTQVNVKAGLTFASALRSFLRQDPDIIMVGEIRDTVTAEIAVEAALTGHLLIATLHTNDAAGVVTRLSEMGVEPFNISASLLGVLAQRLVRRVCKDCKTEYSPNPDILRQLSISPEKLSNRKLYRGVGCEKCGGSGYRGRMAIHELLINDEEVQKAIIKGLSANEIKDVSIEQGMITLRGDGVRKALDGHTTLEEVLAKTSN
ncbi:MAG: ATPase, T2SS/T4P/T4SS family [Deinococcales bacterium]